MTPFELHAQLVLEHYRDEIESIANEELYILDEGYVTKDELVRRDDEHSYPLVTFEDYFKDYYDIKFIIHEDLSYCGCRICIGYGGPNVYINTVDKIITLYWGTTRLNLGLTDKACEIIDEYYHQIYEQSLVNG